MTAFDEACDRLARNMHRACEDYFAKRPEAREPTDEGPWSCPECGETPEPGAPIKWRHTCVQTAAHDLDSGEPIRYRPSAPVEPPEDWESRRGYPRAFHVTSPAHGGHPKIIDALISQTMWQRRREEVAKLHEALRREKKSNRTMQATIGKLQARVGDLERRASAPQLIRLNQPVRFDRADARIMHVTGFSMGPAVGDEGFISGRMLDARAPDA